MNETGVPRLPLGNAECQPTVELPIGTGVASLSAVASWPASLPATTAPSWNFTGSLRPGEIVAILYFLYVGAMAAMRPVAWSRTGLAILAAGGIYALAVTESRRSHAWSRVLRDWLTLGLILIAYWQVDWFATGSHVRWQDTWIGWDRTILDHFHVRAILESAGFLIPSTLELVYLLLYAVPCLALCAIHLWGDRKGIHRFETTLLMGTLTVYALLPHFPTISPRAAFAGADLPHYAGLWRGINVWLLDHYDIATSVFPSGHVAVAFSTAFGLLRAMPRRRAVWSFFFVVAVVVFTATVYCRYHYAVDGFASLIVAALMWRVSEVLDRDV